MIALECWWYQSQEACPCLQWKAQAVQPAPSAWGPGCPCMDSEWSNGRLCKYDKTQSSVLSVCSWDLHPGLGHSSPARVKPSKLQINTAVKGCVYALCGLLHNNEQQCTIVTLTSLLEMKVMKTSSLTVVVATLGPGASNSELPNFFQFWNERTI